MQLVSEKEKLQLQVNEITSFYQHELEMSNEKLRDNKLIMDELESTKSGKRMKWEWLILNTLFFKNDSFVRGSSRFEIVFEIGRQRTG